MDIFARVSPPRSSISRRKGAAKGVKIESVLSSGVFERPMMRKFTLIRPVVTRIEARRLWMRSRVAISAVAVPASAPPAALTTSAR